MNPHQDSIGPPSRPPARPPSGASLRLLLGTLIAVCLGIAVLLLVLMFGIVAGEEFSPQTFQRRSFVQYQLPVLKVQLTPTQRVDSTGSLERYLQAHLLPPAVPGKARWHVVYVDAVGGGRQFGDAHILSNYLQQRHNGDYRWLVWSKSHPAAARCLWSAVAGVARQKLYMLVPELIELAESTTDAAQLRRRIAEQLADEYFWLGRTQQRLGRHTSAVAYFSQALDRRPDDAAALRGRARSYGQLGQADRARADIQHLVRLGHRP